MNIYLTSANPLHFSHVNVMETAEEKIGSPVILGICSNINKISGLFTLAERKQIAIKYYQIPEEKIRIYHEPEEIREAVKKADRIIRGRRDYRAEEVKRELPFPADLAYFKKIRRKKILEMTLKGEIKSRAVIVDDILDTGATLLQSVKILKSRGAKEIIIFISHGLFIGKKWPELFKLGVKKIYVTGSLKLPKNAARYRSKIYTLSIKGLIENNLKLWNKR